MSMVFSNLKKLMPRGLYGRAALILFVPIAVLQLVVVIGFSQRYFSDVTRQLMTGVQAEIGLYVDGANGLPKPMAQGAIADLDARLNFVTSIDDDVSQIQDNRHWYDFSGIIITNILHDEIEGLEGVDLARDNRTVTISIMTNAGRLSIEFPRKRASASNPHQVIIITLVTGLLMAYIGASFLRNQLRPIKRLARAAEAFGRGNVVPYRIAGASEVRAAGMSFLSMRTRIERQIEQRTLMLSGVSHDLRTPITRLKLGLSLLQVEPGSEADIQDMQTDITEMERLLDEFLAFAREEALDDPENLNPDQLMIDAQERASRAGGDVKYLNSSLQDVEIIARPEALARALDNLISNALRYGSKAQLSLITLERSIIFRVEDDGPGIAAEDREKVLLPFVRLDPARNQNKGSSVGLGLAISVDIARKHGGSLRLGESETLGGLQVDIVLAR